MLATIDIPPHLHSLNNASKILAAEISHALSAIGQSRGLQNNTDLLKIAHEGCIFIVKGVFKYYLNKKVVRIFSAGDLVLLGSGQDREATLISEFGSEIILFEWNGVRVLLESGGGLVRNWVEYQGLQIRIMHSLCSLYLSEEHKPEIYVREFSPGDVIINEGEEPFEIFEIVEGTARVSSNGMDLGVINQGEIFGEISFFTGHKRTATVTAEVRCLVQVIRETDFMAIAKNRPQVIVEIARNLSARLLQMDAKLTGR